MLRYCDLYRLGTIPVQKLYSEKDALIVLTNGTEQVQNMYIMYRGCSGPLSDDIEWTVEVHAGTVCAAIFIHAASTAVQNLYSQIKAFFLHLVRLFTIIDWSFTLGYRNVTGFVTVGAVRAGAVHAAMKRYRNGKGTVPFIGAV